MTEFNAKDYWEKRLNETYGIEGVGYKGLGRSYNEWMYRIRKKIFNTYVGKLNIDFKNSSVLDVGSGTGFYIDKWESLGVKDITGSDITQIAVTKLSEKYKKYKFIEADISSNIDQFENKKFDVISAFDVLFHIVDDQKFENAILNISHLLKSNGIFVISDNFIHSKAMGVTHHTNRSLEDFSNTLNNAGFEIILRKPSFFFLNTPVDSNSKLLKRFWNFQMKIIYRGDNYGKCVGALLYPIELCILSFLKEGPSTEIMICKKK